MFGFSGDFYRGLSAGGGGHWSDKLRHSSNGNVDMSAWEVALAQARAERNAARAEREKAQEALAQACDDRIAARVERDVALLMLRHLQDKLRRADSTNPLAYMGVESEHNALVDQLLANYKLRLIRQRGQESRVVRAG